MSDPVAVWSGEIMGVKVHVLDDGRRIIDADDFASLFVGDRFGGLDFEAFAKAFRAWLDEPSPVRGGAEEPKR